MTGRYVPEELCQKLFEISGWTDTHEVFISGEPTWRTEVSTPSTHTPVYRMGFLLDKLDHVHLELKHPYLGENHLNLWGAYYYADDYYAVNYVQAGHSPEEAMAKLAIELFEKGVIRE